LTRKGKAGSDLGPNISIDRKVHVGSCGFKDVFGGFEEVAAVKSIFGSRTGTVLAELRVDIEEGRGYMRINDEAGSIIVNAKYLKEGDETHLYLDVVHELVHIRQHMEGKELWDRRYSYVDRPTEIEAYRAVLEEARRLGLPKEDIVDYLRVDWVTEDEFVRFLRTLGVSK
jgi:hypothetical protein